MSRYSERLWGRLCLKAQRGGTHTRSPARDSSRAEAQGRGGSGWSYITL